MTGPIDRGAVVLAIDAAIAAMHTARTLVEAYAEQEGSLVPPPEADAPCPHPANRRVASFGGDRCRDCGEVIPAGVGVSASAEASAEATVASEV